MLELDVAGVAHLGEAGVTIERAPDGIRFEALTDDHPLLGTLVGTDDKFSAHNAALWEHGLLVHVPAGVEVERRCTCTSRTPPRAARCSGASWSWPRRGAGSR